jgi:hypothetical protein
VYPSLQETLDLEDRVETRIKKDLVDKIIFRARKSRWEQILQGLGSE